jgi:hypothetical protein
VILTKIRLESPFSFKQTQKFSLTLSEKWGSKVIDNIANGINNKYPTLKGFDNRGLYRMMQFYDTYKVNEIVAPLVRQIS